MSSNATLNTLTPTATNAMIMTMVMTIDRPEMMMPANASSLPFSPVFLVWL